jgi:hypothetical protein
MICEAHDVISDTEFITVSSRQYVDIINISFPPTMKDFTMDLPMDCVITITTLENCVTVWWVLSSDFPDGIMLCAIQIVLKLIYV